MSDWPPAGDDWPTDEDVSRMEAEHARRMGRLLENSDEANDFWDLFHTMVPWSYVLDYGHESEDLYIGRMAHHLALMCDSPNPRPNTPPHKES